LRFLFSSHLLFHFFFFFFVIKKKKNKKKKPLLSNNYVITASRNSCEHERKRGSRYVISQRCRHQGKQPNRMAE